MPGTRGQPQDHGGQPPADGAIPQLPLY